MVFGEVDVVVVGIGIVGVGIGVDGRVAVRGGRSRTVSYRIGRRWMGCGDGCCVLVLWKYVVDGIVCIVLSVV